MKPPVCILRTDGTNCDLETAYAFEKCGGRPQLVHVNQLRTGDVNLDKFRILVIPGGSAYGDGVRSGKVWAVELVTRFREKLTDFVGSGNLMLGIGNGFQVLVRAGFLPEVRPGEARAALTPNEGGRFECRWVETRVEKSPCVFTAGMEGRVLSYQVAHGEGKFFTTDPVLDELEEKGQVVLRYVDPSGKPTALYPYNPNGSLNAVAGLCDPSGRIFGLMPHPERYVERTQHPLWRRHTVPSEPDGLSIFRNAIEYVTDS